MMTIDKIGGLVESKHAEIFGSSKDVKPLNVENNDLFIELDTTDVYYFDNGTWKKMGGEE